MTRLLLVLALIVIALPGALRGDPLSNQAPLKPEHVVVPPPADPEVIRQGGDTIDDATVVAAIPYDNTGTTAGYTDDYDEVCPYNTPGSPDVVYTYTPAGDIEVNIDLLGSTYDTKLYVYDADLNLVACNDDFYSDYVSKLEYVPLLGGMRTTSSSTATAAISVTTSWRSSRSSLASSSAHLKASLKESPISWTTMWTNTTLAASVVPRGCSRA